jgi:RimJ/RimL family protein N-acetyltransferase/nitroimidazol reductase NimA-like FMN-containing flavoprotein (pyridoxamine 5'-phosphate oxidase superfamily)
MTGNDEQTPRDYERTARSTATRLRDRVSYERATAHAIFDEAYHCHLSFVVDGEPRMLPTLHVRIGDVLYLHGSTGSGPLLAARTGLPVCVAVTHLDGIVYARSQFHHSANYRSVVAHGSATLVTGEDEKRRVLTALVEKVGAGRSADTRPPSRRELAETAVLALPLREVSVKARDGGPVDEPEDYPLPYWAGVVPLRLTPGPAIPDAGMTRPVPTYLPPARSAWLQPAVLAGSLVRLEPLAMSHVDDLFRALDDPEVWHHLSTARPADPAALSAAVAAALADAEHGQRVPWVQRHAGTGEVIGTTSYHLTDPENRSLAIGYTWLGRPWWRSGINTEAKLLLLERAFGTLGAVRVSWFTDERNDRSQRAIERLGATREGILRSHRRRPDGTWRDSVLYSMTTDDWPAARERLAARLRAGLAVA